MWPSGGGEVGGSAGMRVAGLVVSPGAGAADGDGTLTPSGHAGGARREQDSTAQAQPTQACLICGQRHMLRESSRDCIAALQIALQKAEEHVALLSEACALKIDPHPRVRPGERYLGVETTLTADQWARINRVRELVKQEGDRDCEAAFDDLLADLAHVRIAALGAQYNEGLAMAEVVETRAESDAMRAALVEAINALEMVSASLGYKYDLLPKLRAALT